MEVEADAEARDICHKATGCQKHQECRETCSSDVAGDVRGHGHIDRRISETRTLIDDYEYSHE